jgi:hypothetical protein
MNAHRNARALAITATTLALGLSGCSSADTISPSDSSPSAVPPSTVTPSATPATPADTAKQKAIAAYVGMWQDVAEVSHTSDWQSPKLGDHTTGDALSVLSRQMYADHYNGLVSQGAPVNTPTVQSVDSQDVPKTVMIKDCGDDSNWLKYRADNGKLADNEPGGKRAITAEAKLATDGSWRITRFAVEGIGTCTT